MASGYHEDFDVKRDGQTVSFTVRTGDGAPYRVYLSGNRASELAAGICDVMKVCTSTECMVAHQALETAVSKAEELLQTARGFSADIDAIVCVENDTRHDMKLPPKEDE